VETKKRIDRPKVGVGVAVVKEGKLLLGKRKGAHGEGSWAPAGGHLEYGETPEDCAARELKEETGLKALSLKVGPWTNNVFEEGKHYFTIFVLVDQFEGEPQLLEPDKCEGWEWFDWAALPSPLFPSVQSFIEKMHSSGGMLDPLIAKLLAFYRERDWEQFHSPKNIVMDLASEVGELIEPFRWLTEQQSYHLDEAALEQVRDEIGDVFIVLNYLAYKLGIDPIEASNQKLKKIGENYPVALSRGKALKYTAYQSVKT